MKDHALICDLRGGAPRCVAICQKAGHGALEALSGGFRPVYGTFANDPVICNDAVAANLYGRAIEEEDSE